MLKRIIIILLIQFLSIASMLLPNNATDFNIKIVQIANGWARTSINTVIFRRNSIISYKNYQYVAFYDEHAQVILAKRNIESTEWELFKTRYKGQVQDAHNSISIMIDGDGYLHMSWDHHGNPLSYCKSKLPEGLELTDKMAMTGYGEQKVTYPEFYRLPDGNLIFIYRDGESGSGNAMMNYYDTKNKTWSKLHDNLIDGEGERNAYWQLAIGTDGTIHLSWLWRESWDVATIHDICYAKSRDHGKTWLKSTGEKYKLPINAKSAEYAAKIPQGSDLINQTSMATDSKCHPYISTYWTPQGTQVPQYHLVYLNDNGWKTKQVSRRSTPFSLSGGGTKRIPISRPQILIDSNDTIYLVYRDIEQDNHISIATCDNLEMNTWGSRDLTSFPVGQWEPMYDSGLWESENKLHLLIQNVAQGDAENVDDIPPQMVSVLEWERKN